MSNLECPISNLECSTSYLECPFSNKKCDVSGKQGGISNKRCHTSNKENGRSNKKNAVSNKENDCAGFCGIILFTNNPDRTRHFVRAAICKSRRSAGRGLPVSTHLIVTC